MARDIISTVNPLTLAPRHLFNISIFVAFIPKLNGKRTEIMCQSSLTGRIVQIVVEIIICLFFPTIASKNVYQLSEKILFSSVFYFLSLRDPHCQEIRYLLFVRIDISRFS